MFHIVAGVEADNRITEAGEAAVGVEILSMHAAITGRINEEWARRRGALHRAT